MCQYYQDRMSQLSGLMIRACFYHVSAPGLIPDYVNFITHFIFLQETFLKHEKVNNLSLFTRTLSYVPFASLQRW